MKRLALIGLLCSGMFAQSAPAADLEEQQRRCRIEKNSLTRDGSDTGPECLALRAMLGLPEPPQVNIYNSGGGSNRFYDQRIGRWCTHHGGSVSCE